MCDLDTPLNSLLLHSDTLCVLSYDGLEDLRGSIDQDGQETSQDEDGQEDEDDGGARQAGLADPVRPRPAMH